MKQIEITKNVQKWGNSAGILLPREYVGKEAKIVLIDRSLEIKKEVFDILEDYLEDILGIYLTGSYARGEQTKTSDIDMLVISKDTSKEIVSGKYHISVVPLESIKKIMKKHPILILPRLAEAKPILNAFLLEDLKKIKIKRESFNSFLQDTKRIMGINENLIEIDKLEEKKNVSSSAIYSLILRLRGISMMKCLLQKKKYSKKDFWIWLDKILDKNELERAYNLYESIRDDHKIISKVKIESAEKLLNFLKKEIKNAQKKKEIKKRN